MTQLVRADWEGALLVCRKCSKRVGARFGAEGDRPLAKALRKELGVKSGRKARLGVVEVGCLKLCPKKGVVVVDTRDPGRWRVVAPGDDLGALRTPFSAPAKAGA